MRMFTLVLSVVFLAMFVIGNAAVCKAEETQKPEIKVYITTGSGGTPEEKQYVEAIVKILSKIDKADDGKAKAVNITETDDEAIKRLDKPREKPEEVNFQYVIGTPAANKLVNMYLQKDSNKITINSDGITYGNEKLTGKTEGILLVANDLLASHTLSLVITSHSPEFFKNITEKDNKILGGVSGNPAIYKYDSEKHMVLK
ncbi:MAG: hypothetical protein WA705_02325 [Candidatus Ozemobacteraceae bacterium]